jgi:hypothetical protein
MQESHQLPDPSGQHSSKRPSSPSICQLYQVFTRSAAYRFGQRAARQLSHPRFTTRPPFPIRRHCRNCLPTVATDAFPFVTAHPGTDIHHRFELAVVPASHARYPHAGTVKQWFVHAVQSKHAQRPARCPGAEFGACRRLLCSACAEHGILQNRMFGWRAQGRRRRPQTPSGDLTAIKVHEVFPT